jgi:alkanesulfonate monooxygenase SsuD/methylene tetrahydromethanopterin reductase-like flavin-dependent oxidoreductase (luciferase family)
LNNPLRIAEEVATVDQISQGRFDFGIGRSGFPRVYDIYGVPYAESQARFQEALEIILEAWKGEPFSYEGKFDQIKNAAVAPRPYQLPHSPLRMAATMEETYPLCVTNFRDDEKVSGRPIRLFHGIAAGRDALGRDGHEILRAALLHHVDRGIPACRGPGPRGLRRCPRRVRASWDARQRGRQSRDPGPLPLRPRQALPADG